MFIEKRRVGTKDKYYLIHSYRTEDEVKRLSKYLGADLNEIEIKKAKLSAELDILSKIESEKDIFHFKFTREQLKKFESYDHKIRIEHLQRVDWQQFTENFTYNTNAIEGSYVSYNKVIRILEDNTKPKSDDEKETVNVAAAVDFIKNANKKLSVELINKIHSICFEGTKSYAGKIRDVDVVIRNAKGIVHVGSRPGEVKLLLKKLCGWYEKNKNNQPPLFLAAIIHNDFEHIHPYQDGNGRVGRLLLNWVLLRHSYPPINISLNDRQEYYTVLNKFSRKGEIEPTLKFLIKQYKRDYT